MKIHLQLEGLPALVEGKQRVRLALADAEIRLYGYRLRRNEALPDRIMPRDLKDSGMRVNFIDLVPARLEHLGDRLAVYREGCLRRHDNKTPILYAVSPLLPLRKVGFRPDPCEFPILFFLVFDTFKLWAGAGASCVRRVSEFSSFALKEMFVLRSREIVQLVLALTAALMKSF